MTRASFCDIEFKPCTETQNVREKTRADFSTGGLKTTLYYQLIPFSMTTPLNSRLAVVSILVPRVVSMTQREHENLAPVVRRLVNAIHRINRYPADKC